MKLGSLTLFNYKNYESLNSDFGKINCFLGKNGSGKTNLLDSIHYLCIGKSAISTSESNNIKQKEDFFTIKGNFTKYGKTDKILINYKKGAKKIIKKNQKEYGKISEHIGQYPCVLIVPNDTDLVREGSEIRRKFFDNTISQTDKQYLYNLIRYNRVLKQRNTLLKQFAENRFDDPILIDTFDQQLIEYGEKISKRREEFISEFKVHLKDLYQTLSEDADQIALEYKSDFKEENFYTDFKNAYQKDLQLQRTTIGPHKDDFIFKIESFPLKKFGSQGQQKSFVIALKFAQYFYIEKQTGLKPILLLDDIFDKLDDFRIKKLLEMISKDQFGQLFITDARPERSKELINQLSDDVRFFEIQKGEII